MRQFIIPLLSLSLLFLWQGKISATVWSCSMPDCPTGCGEGGDGGLLLEDETSFTRTYQHFKSTSHNKVTRTEHIGRGNGLVISESEFMDHMALDKERVFRVIPRGNSIPMDVGAFDQFGDEAQVWNMPDFNQFNVIDNMRLEHVSPESTGFGHAYPEATHCFFIEHRNMYEFVEMTNDDLFVLGNIEVDENDDGYLFDAFLTATPIPLELGLEFEGIVIIEYTDDPDIDSMIYTQDYIISGYGTLNTYDEGPVDAIKMNYSQLSLEFKDGQVIDSIFIREIVWYSPDGHYLRGSLPDDMPTSGQTTFFHMEYQRLESGVSTKEIEHQNASLNFFPNPIGAGDVLTITNEKNTQFGLIQLFDMQGRLVQQLDLSSMGTMDNFQVKLPQNLVSGLYTYQVYTPQGTPMGQGKLQIK